MKTLIVIAVSTLMSFNGFSQSISFEELLKLSAGNNNEQLLSTKLFKFQPQMIVKNTPTVKYYIKNAGTKNAEKIVTGFGSLNQLIPVTQTVYETTDTAYISNFMKQVIQTGLRLSQSKDLKGSNRYQFKGKGLFVFVSKRKDGKASQVSLIK